ncbi:MAG: carboxylate-amine ligase [Geminicoccaceae bacterium]
MAPRPPRLTLGIEEEYLLVDPETRDLRVDPGDGFMADCRDALGDQICHELMRSQCEIGTSVADNVGQLRADLTGLRSTVANTARAHGMAMVAVSTHPFANWRDQRRVEMDRYRVLESDLQTLAHRLVICGMHIHVGIDDKDLRIDLLNQLTYFLPHLLALSTSSPFWQGEPTGLKAFRPTIFEDLPRSGLPEQFASHSDWEQMLAMLEATGLCTDASMIWWDARPSVKHPTLEVRICDICTRIDDTIAVAALVQSLVAYLYRLRRNNQTWRSYRRILIAENKWQAQRHGIEGELADFGQQRRRPFADLIEDMFELFENEADELGCVEELHSVRTILERGTSADRQLKVFREAKKHGADTREALNAVVDWLIEESVVGLS